MRLAACLAGLLLALACTPTSPPGPCVPECGARVCGRDPVCGTLCGTGCANDGVCSDDGLTCRAALAIGAACTTDLACGSGRTCLGEDAHAPGGYCSRRCDEANACPEGATCGFAAGERFCLATCSPSAPADSCRTTEGYACSGEGVCPACVPDCTGRTCGDDGCGGSCGLCYDPGLVCSAGTCGAGFSDVDALPVPARFDSTAVVADTGVVWIIGGREIVDDPNGASYSRGLRRVETYTLTATNKVFAQGPSLPVAIAAPQVASYGQTFWIAGGTDDPDGPEATDGIVSGFWKLERGIWEPKENPPVATRGGALVAIGQKIYLFAGDTASGLSDRVDVYDPEARVWSTGPARPTKRAYFATATDGNRAFVLGGWDGTQALATTEIFDPASGWSAGPVLPRAYAHGKAVFTSDRIFVFGGIDGPALGFGDVKPEILVWDFKTGTTSIVGLTPDNLILQAPARHRDGRVLLYGGTFPIGATPTPRNDVYEFSVPTR